MSVTLGHSKVHLHRWGWGVKLKLVCAFWAPGVLHTGSYYLRSCLGFHHGMLCPSGLLPELRDARKRSLRKNVRQGQGYEKVSSEGQIWLVIVFSLSIKVTTLRDSHSTVERPS